WRPGRRRTSAAPPPAPSARASQRDPHAGVVGPPDDVVDAGLVAQLEVRTAGLGAGDARRRAVEDVVHAGEDVHAATDPVPARDVAVEHAAGPDLAVLLLCDLAAVAHLREVAQRPGRAAPVVGPAQARDALPVRRTEGAGELDDVVRRIRIQGVVAVEQAAVVGVERDRPGLVAPPGGQ